VDRRPLEEGKVATCYVLWRLRVQAWMKIGLGPDVLSTRDETVKVRVRRHFCWWSRNLVGKSQ
jgi:hypothetical protein